MARCGWCLTRNHDECHREICDCGCPVRTGFWLAERTGRYCYRCPRCLYGRGADSEHGSFLLFFDHECKGRSRMDTPIKSGAQRCWDYLDGVVDRIGQLNAELASVGAVLATGNPTLADGVRPAEHVQRDLEAWQNLARGAAACMAIIYALRPETISAECGQRAVYRAAGQPRPYFSDAELRGMYEPAGRS